ncbi:GNAT family acetyltransferase-like protein [Bisporella sp. PMI_857]|nr:GNAT family acetyltransferase-like protein [Bisporella sp. PMI_857]KAH8600594.1 GNAT family acetyltransferase-like protein [Bisporella sp. PMI_857]
MSSKEGFIIRPSRLSDLPILAAHHQRAYQNSPVNSFLTPHANKYPEDEHWILLQRCQKRFVQANGYTLVACPASNPSLPVGHAIFCRVGTDAAARRIVHEKGLWKRAWLWILSWYFCITRTIANLMWKDRISDAERVKKFSVQTVVVDPVYQGKGIGKLLLKDVIERAQRERVLIGLTASPHGEHLYRKLGFELVGDFGERLPTETDLGGGIMIWYPEGWEGNRHEPYISWSEKQKQKIRQT